MAIVTSQQITRYYNEYLNTEITFTKDIIRTLNMDPRQIYIKCAGDQWPCIINSTSFVLARIIVGTKGGAFAQISKPGGSAVSLKYSFYQADGQLMSFFISGKVSNITPYMNSQELVIVTIAYTQRPPDDLIQMVGHLLDANTNAIRRKEERIPINADSMRKLGIPKEEQVVLLDNVPRHCILRDLSFGGCKILLVGLERFLKNKPVKIQLEFDEPHEIITLDGTVVEVGPVEGRKEIVSANVRFEDSSITLSYKIHINNYITTTRKNELSSGTQFEEPV